MYNIEKIKNLRISKNLNQSDIANILGVSRSTYSMWESNNDIFPIKRLITFCDYFNVSIDYILDLTNTLQYSNNKKQIDTILSGKRLKELRKSTNLTQVQLANILNIAPTIIVEYEHGRYIVSIHVLYSLCKKYNISADYLLGRIDSPKYLKN